MNKEATQNATGSEKWPLIKKEATRKRNGLRKKTSVEKRGNPKTQGAQKKPLMKKQATPKRKGLPWCEQRRNYNKMRAFAILKIKQDHQFTKVGFSKARVTLFILAVTGCESLSQIAQRRRCKTNCMKATSQNKSHEGDAAIETARMRHLKTNCTMATPQQKSHEDDTINQIACAWCNKIARRWDSKNRTKVTHRQHNDGSWQQRPFELHESSINHAKATDAGAAKTEAHRYQRQQTTMHYVTQNGQGRRIVHSHLKAR
jgi:hypothetical protein